MSAIVAALFYSYRWYERAVRPSRADELGSSIVSRIVNDIRSAESIDLASSAFGVTNGRLGIFVRDSSSNVTFKVYSIENGRIMFKEGAAGTPQYLSPADMNATELRFAYTPLSTATDVRFSLKFNYTLRTSDTGMATSTYSGKAIMRNSYE